MNGSAVKKLKKRMEEEGVEAVLVTPSSNMEYLMGSRIMADERFGACVFFAEREPFAFVNSLYRQEAEKWGIQDCVFWSDGEDPYRRLAELFEERGQAPARMAVENGMPAGWLLRLEKEFPAAQFTGNDRVTGALRRIKDDKERERMKEACRRCTEALRETVSQGRAWIGKTEGEFAQHLCREMEKRGISQAGALVCTGANASFPHYMGKDGVIRENMGLLVDFGGRYEGYWSDMSRTFYFSGKEGADGEFCRAYETVLRAVERAAESAEEGKRMEEVDAVCRNVIQNAGYGEYFPHRTGHGIGLDNHEEPCAVQGEKSRIEEGMAFSIEPGIYIPGKFGIRIEEQVLIENHRAKCLHGFTRELIVF